MLLLQPRILINLSRGYTGPGKLKSKPNTYKILASRSINNFLVTTFYSVSEQSSIILEKLGEIGYSSFAAKSKLITESATTC
jgi:hypothetical protein